jgi:hypothetical protein
MRWFDALRQRWFRGRRGDPLAHADEQRGGELLSSPDATAQLSSVPDEQKDEILDSSSGSSAPDQPPR